MKQMGIGKLNEELNNTKDADQHIINKEVVNETIVLNVKKFEKYYKING